MTITSKKTIAILTILFCAFTVFAQKQFDPNMIETEVQGGVSMMGTIIKSVIGVMAAAGLLFTGWAIINNNPQAKAYGVAAVVGLIVFAIAYKMVG